MERKGKIILAIQAIEHRRDQLDNLLSYFDCPLCQELACDECPAYREKGVAYSCQDFGNDIENIQEKLEAQKEQFEMLLKKEG